MLDTIMDDYFYHGLCPKGQSHGLKTTYSGDSVSRGPMRSLEKQQEQTCLQWSGTVVPW